VSIQIKVALVISALVIALTAALTGISIFLTRDSLIKMTREDLEALSEIAGGFIDTKITLLEADVETVALRVASTPPEKLPEIFQQAQVHYPDFLAFTVFNRQGPVASWGNPPTPPFRVENSKYLQKAFEGKGVISTSRLDAKTRKLIIHVCAPIDADRVLSVSINGLVFQSLLDSFKLWHAGKLFLVDERGTAIVSPSLEDVLERRSIYDKINDPETAEWHGAIAKAIRIRTGVDDYSYKGEETIFSWKTLDELTEGWVVGVIAPLQKISIAESRKILLLSAAIFLGISLLVVFLFSEYAARPFVLIKAQNQNLKELNESIVIANEAKSTFLANMSHEMRTPLNAIIGLAELVLSTRDNQSSPEDTENLEKILNAGSTLLSIINDILDISKINSGKFEILPVDYDMPSLINDTAVQNAILISEKPIELTLKVDPKIPSRLFGDDLRMRQIFNNLVSNAFKYTKAGTVSINFGFEHGTSDKDIWLIFSISDTGIGIRPEDLGKLFDNYAQMDTRANRMIKGTGLGLPIVKQLVELMGGRITVESEYGRGSAFTVRIRQKVASGTPIGEEVAENLAQLRFNYTSFRRSGKMSWIPLPYAKVLVVDDVPTNLDVAKGLMKLYGMQIDCVASGQAAIDLIRAAEPKYNAIFMDHMMPEMDGIEAVQIIRKEIGSDYARTVPIIALTANAVLGSEKMFLENGFQAFVSKPIDIMQLDSVIRQWVRDKSQEENPFSRTAPPEESSPRPNAGLKPPREESGGAAQTPSAWIEGKIDGLDMQKCLAGFGGDKEICLKILESYVHHTPVLLEKIRTLDPETLKNYGIIAHGIKGSSRNIGADVVGNLAESLEKAAKAGNFAFVEANNLPFIEAAEKLLAALSEKLNACSNPKLSRNAPDPETLETLRQACKNFDIDRMNQAMKSLSAYEYSTDDGRKLMAWLEEKTFLLDFRAIAKRLAEETPN